jgi:hypothetical protein
MIFPIPELSVSFGAKNRAVKGDSRSRRSSGISPAVATSGTTISYVSAYINKKQGEYEGKIQRITRQAIALK